VQHAGPQGGRRDARGARPWRPLRQRARARETRDLPRRRPRVRGCRSSPPPSRSWPRTGRRSGSGSGVRALARAGETRLRDHHCGTRGEGRSLRRGEGIAGRAPSTFCGALPAAADRVTKVAWLLFRRGILCTSWTTGVCSSLIFELLSCMGLYPMYIHAYHSSHKTPQICRSDRTI
jgi:hypothetical protein